jgi:RNA polymerase sigma-70 factor, ECF subfamily
MESQIVADDTSLLARIAKSDQIALSELYDRYAKIIYSVAFKSLRSVEESEEIVLDVFAQVWRIADRYDPVKSRVDTWLFMLTRSRVLDRLRKNQRSNPSSALLTDIFHLQSFSSKLEPIEELMICERRDRVLSALKILPPEQRLVIELAYYQGLTHSQIASQIGMSLGTVKTRIRLGLSKLKSALDVEVYI